MHGLSTKRDPCAQGGEVDVQLILVGNARDFIDDKGAGAPRWEHQLFLRERDCTALAIDRLASSPDTWLPGKRYLDVVKIYRMRAALRRARVVLAQSEQSGYEAALALAGRTHRRLCIIFHGHYWWTRRSRWLAAVAGRMPSVHFLCLSSALRDLLLEEYGIPESRTHVTGYGVDAEFFRPMAAAASGGIVSAGTASRDYQTLVRAAAGLETQVLVAADSNWYKEPLNVDAANVAGNVSFFSCGSYAELRSLYARARFVVVPLRDVRYAAGYAVIAEAMAMGKAVIATRTSAPSDLIADGVSGLYVPPGDVTALRQAMRTLLEDERTAMRMGEDGRRRVERYFNLDAYATRLRQALALA
jgi:glycosyltransferase involved in cell wall biosynthesis